MIDWGSVIVAACSLLGTIIGSYKGAQLTSYKIEQLEKKVEKHNNFAERMPVVEKEIKHIYHELDELKECKK